MTSVEVAAMEKLISDRMNLQKDKAAAKQKDKPKISIDGKQILSGVYVTGFCISGGHENTQVISGTGALLRACSGEYEVRSGFSLKKIVCTCPCHASFREMREIAAAARRAEEDAAFFQNAIRSTFGHSDAPTLGPPTLETAPTAAPPASNTPTPAPAPAPRRPTELLIVDLSDNFKPTPTGRAARGQLEERVRVVVAKYHKEMHDMMTPTAIGLLINKEDPPSPGAIHAIFTRWERQAFVVLAKKPFRLVELTERGKRQLIH